MHPTFGRYELLKRLAGGGMGEVYLARQRGLDGFQKLLVIKTLLPHLCEDEEFITMFKDEARLTAQLIHPNVCQVFEFDKVENTYYIAMEYLRGEDLRRLFRACDQAAKPLRVPLICRIIADAAAGLDFAHSLRDHEGNPYGIVHRDISPQNILVTFEGGVKVIDFGVAKAAGRAQHTRTGALKGKYSYMSPEQVMGKHVDHRTDIFALGVVLHELLTGKRLFKADSDVETLERVRQTKVLPPSALNPQVPQSLDGIVMHALTREPDERFQSAQEMRLALEDWLIQGRMSASNAHLAEFLKVIYAERLDKENRLGPLMGDVGLSAIPEQLGGKTPTGSVPNSSSNLGAAPIIGTPSNGSATVNQRAAGSSDKSQIDLSQIRTESGAGPFKQASNKQLPLAIGLGVVAIAVAALLVIKRTPAGPPPAQLAVKSEPAGAALSIDGRTIGITPATADQLHQGPVHLHLALEGYAPFDADLQLNAGVQEQGFQLEKLAPKKFSALLDSDPRGAEIREGAVLIGTAGHNYSLTAGVHPLTFSLAGYRDESLPFTSTHDGQELNVKLIRIAPERPPTQAIVQTPKPPLNDIKVER
jgi:serine/threonine protein kinase